MSNEAKGPYTVVPSKNDGDWIVVDKDGHKSHGSGGFAYCNYMATVCNAVHSQALTSQAARVKELEEDREWLRAQWERHRNALNAIAWGEYDNVAFCRRLAQDELAIGVKVANDRAAATVAALTPREPQ